MYDILRLREETWVYGDIKLLSYPWKKKKKKGVFARSLLEIVDQQLIDFLPFSFLFFAK